MKLISTVTLALVVGLTATPARAQIIERVLVKVKEDYSEPVNVYALVSLPPASRKSGVFGAMAAPLERWEAEVRSGS